MSRRTLAACTALTGAALLVSLAQPGSAAGGPAFNAPVKKVYGTTFAPGKKPVLTLLDPVAVTQAGFPEAPGDFLMSTFDNAGKMTTTWTRAVQQVDIGDGGATGEGQRSLFRDSYSATSK